MEGSLLDDKDIDTLIRFFEVLIEIANDDAEKL